MQTAISPTIPSLLALCPARLKLLSEVPPHKRVRPALLGLCVKGPTNMQISCRVVFLMLTLASPLCAATSGQTSTPYHGKNFDGPAELPREYVKSSLKDTPAGGKTWGVRPGQSLEQ